MVERQKKLMWLVRKKEKVKENQKPIKKMEIIFKKN